MLSALLPGGFLLLITTNDVYKPNSRLVWDFLGHLGQGAELVFVMPTVRQCVLGM